MTEQSPETPVPTRAFLSWAYRCVVIRDYKQPELRESGAALQYAFDDEASCHAQLEQARIAARAHSLQTGHPCVVDLHVAASFSLTVDGHETMTLAVPAGLRTALDLLNPAADEPVTVSGPLWRVLCPDHVVTYELLDRAEAHRRAAAHDTAEHDGARRARPTAVS